MSDRHPIKVSISTDFLESYSRISKNKQSRVRDFIEKFKADPASHGLHYEKINNARDPNIRSVRVNDQYRAIVLKPEQGNVFMLLWVDNHDDAYDWARNRKFQIHPETGALQVFDVSEVEVTPEKKEKEEDKGLFKDFRDRELIRLGIPEDLLPLIRTITSESELEGSENKMPEESFEALYMLAAGYTQEEVYNEIVASKPATIDTSDFSRALSRPESQRRFAVIEDDIELQEILAAPLEHWRIFLHPSQRRIVQMKANGPVRVLGGAGTGKTVVAMHRAKWLAENFFTEDNDRILFTTFTRNLSVDIKTNLQKLCSPQIMRRIEVINIDAWVSRFLKKQDYDYKIIFDKEAQPLWKNSLNIAENKLDLSEQFYKNEWEQVIQQQGITDIKTYLRASRVGRGRRLCRRDRLKVWPVFEEYRSQMNDRHYKEFIDAARDARQLLEQMGDILPYAAIIVDEAQDMNAEVFRLIRQMIPVENEEHPNDIFITGDSHQRIYSNKIVLGHCGIDIRGRGRRLRINYRTTEETRGWAVRLLEGKDFDDLDGEAYDQRGYKSLMHGPLPIIKKKENFTAEVNTISEYISKLKEIGTSEKDICLVARTNYLMGQYEGALQMKNFKTYQIHRSKAEERTEPGIRIATMHRVKGLEFDHVIIAGVNQGTVPLSKAMEADNPHEKAERETRERSLLYVSATRAKKSVLITSSGKPSEFIS